MKLKIIIPISCIVIIVISIFILILHKPKNVQVTVLKMPYNIMTVLDEEYENGENDTFCIKIYVNQKKSYYTNINKITNCDIVSDESTYHLKIEKIEEENISYKLKGELFYLYNYYFSFDFKFNDCYLDELKDAKLRLVFSNGIQSTLSIGSFSFYKYYEDNSLTLSFIKVIHHDLIEGLVLGLRNYNNKDIVIKKIEALDANIKNINKQKESSTDIVNDINQYYNNYPNLIDNDNDIVINKNDIKYIMIPIVYENNSLDILPGSFGFKVSTIIDGENKDCYIPKMMLFDYQFSISEDKLTFYEYENK